MSLDDLQRSDKGDTDGIQRSAPAPLSGLSTSLDALETSADTNETAQDMATEFVRACQKINPVQQTRENAEVIREQTTLMASLITKGLAHDQPLGVPGFEKQKPLELAAHTLTSLAFFPEVVGFPLKSGDQKEAAGEVQAQAHEGLRRVVSACLRADMKKRLSAGFLKTPPPLGTGGPRFKPPGP